MGVCKCTHMCTLTAAQWGRQGPEPGRTLEKDTEWSRQRPDLGRKAQGSGFLGQGVWSLLFCSLETGSCFAAQACLSFPKCRDERVCLADNCLIPSTPNSLWRSDVREGTV